MKENDKIFYVEAETLAIVKLYVEAYMRDAEKGFKTLSEKEARREKLKTATQEVIEETSDLLGISIEEIISIIKGCLKEDRKGAEKRKNYEEEYALLEEVLESLNKSKDEQER